MKRILLLFTLLIITSISFNIKAQCTPGNYSEPGIYPDTATGIPPAVATQQYDFVFTIVVPKDTTISIMGVPQTVQIDSIGITDVTGLPSVFQYLPNSSTGYWPGDTSGCVLLTGTPQTSDVGVYPIEIQTMFYASGYSAPFTITGYELEVLDSTHVGIHEDQIFGKIKGFPNPFNSEINFEFDTYENTDVTIEIFNMVGRIVKQKSIKASTGLNSVSFNTSSLNKGVYFYRISAADKVITRKLVKK